MSEQHERPVIVPSPADTNLCPCQARWSTGPLLGLDTETTGVDPQNDRLVTAALVARDPLNADGTRPQTVTTWLTDPGVEIPVAAAQVHGITTERARSEGRPATDVLEEVATALADAMAAGTPVATVRERLGHGLGPLLDPLVLDRRVDRYRKGKRRLSDLCAVYDVEVDDSLHTAEVDAIATLDVLEAIVSAHPELARLRLDELVPFQAQAHRAWATSFNAWLAHKNPGRAGVELDWPLLAGT